jgi:DNA mismatch repair protein MutS2
MGMPGAVLDRANELLDHEDRRLDRMLSELAASRAALEREQREAARLRAESEAARSEYRERVERLRARRDELYRAMRHDLDRAFREAHGRVAEVIRELQRAGTARDAARARERLLALESEARSAAATAAEAVVAGEVPAPEPAPPAAPVDWRFAAAGDAVVLRDGATATLLALPDRRGRVAVQVGSARVLVPADRVAALRSAPRPAPPRVAFETEARRAGADLVAGGTGHCDLRGLRADEALDRLAAEIDRALAAGRGRLEIVHGIGTGVLRRAVREHLAASPFVTRAADAPADQGGDGVTIAELA